MVEADINVYWEEKHDYVLAENSKCIAEIVEEKKFFCYCVYYACDYYEFYIR